MIFPKKELIELHKYQCLIELSSEGWELIAVTSDVIQNRIAEQLSKPPKTVTTFLDTYYFNF